jgi:hypothetical protein
MYLFIIKLFIDYLCIEFKKKNNNNNNNKIYIYYIYSKIKKYLNSIL